MSKRDVIVKAVRSGERALTKRTAMLPFLVRAIRRRNVRGHVSILVAVSVVCCTASRTTATATRRTYRVLQVDGVKIAELFVARVLGVHQAAISTATHCRSN